MRIKPRRRRSDALPAGARRGGAVGGAPELVLLEDRYEVQNARVVAEGVEIKQFTNDGAALIVTRFTDGFEAANPDNVLIDLATGEEARATYALDYDEPLEYSPDGQWFVVRASNERSQLKAVFVPIRAC